MDNPNSKKPRRVKAPEYTTGWQPFLPKYGIRIKVTVGDRRLAEQLGIPTDEAAK